MCLRTPCGFWNPSWIGGKRTAEHGLRMKLVRRTVTGALVVGGAFAVVTVFRSITSGGDFLDSLNPILLFALIGATVGGLVGPLVGAAIEGFRGRRG